MKAINTLSGMEDKITTIRRDGNTTRVIDNAIQLLFKHGSIAITDHTLNYVSNRELFFKILKRMESEHPNIKLNKDLGIISIVK